MPLLRSESSIWAFPGILWFLIGGASPVVAGIGLAAITGGETQLRELGRRLVDRRRIAGKWWLVWYFSGWGSIRSASHAST